MKKAILLLNTLCLSLCTLRAGPVLTGVSPASATVVHVNPQSQQSWLQALDDTTISGSQLTFTAGVISGSTGLFPGIGGIYGSEYLRDLAMAVRCRPADFSAQFVWNQIKLFASSQYSNGALPDSISPSGAGGLAAANQYYAVDDCYEFVDLVFSHFLMTGTTTAFTTYASNIAAALAFPPVSNHLVVLPAVYSGTGHLVGFGFQDTCKEAGAESMCSAERWRAEKEMGIMAQAAGVTDSYTSELSNITNSLNSTLWDANTGLYWNATVSCTEHSIAASAYIWYLGAGGTTATAGENTLAAMATNPLDVQNGQVRHMPWPEYWDNSTSTQQQYQNGGYWATFTGWFCGAVSNVNLYLAEWVFSRYVDAAQAQGPAVAPYEATNSVNGYHGIAGYCVSAGMPLQGLGITSGTFNR
jgi:hypothetical protein